MASKVTTIMSNLKTALEGISGAIKVWKVGAFSPSIIGRAAGSTGFPVFLLKSNTRRPLDQKTSGGTRLTLSALSVSIVAMNNGRDETDEDWGQEQAEELERLVTAAILADGTRGANAVDTVWDGTTYNPATEGAQIGAMVALEFTVRHYVQRADLEQSSA